MKLNTLHGTKHKLLKAIDKTCKEFGTGMFIINSIARAYEVWNLQDYYCVAIDNKITFDGCEDYLDKVIEFDYTNRFSRDCTLKTTTQEEKNDFKQTIADNEKLDIANKKELVVRLKEFKDKYKQDYNDYGKILLCELRNLPYIYEAIRKVLISNGYVSTKNLLLCGMITGTLSLYIARDLFINKNGFRDDDEEDYSGCIKLLDDVIVLRQQIVSLYRRDRNEMLYAKKQLRDYTKLLNAKSELIKLCDMEPENDVDNEVILQSNNLVVNNVIENDKIDNNTSKIVKNDVVYDNILLNSVMIEKQALLSMVKIEYKSCCEVNNSFAGTLNKMYYSCKNLIFDIVNKKYIMQNTKMNQAIEYSCLP